MTMSGSSDTRHRVERIDERPQHVLQTFGQTDREPERNRYRHGDASAENEFLFR